MEFFKTRTFRVLLLTVAVIGLLLITYVLRTVFTPLLLAFILAYILDPLVTWFEKMRLSRAGAIAVLYTLGLALFVVTVGGLFAFVLEQVEAATDLAKSGIDELVKEPWFVNLHEQIGREASTPESQQKIAEAIKENVTEISTGVTTVVEFFEEQLSSLLNILMYFLLVPLYTFFLLLNFDKILETIRAYLPGLYRDRIVDLANQVHTVLSSFFRGRLIIGLIITILAGLGYLAFGCPVPFLFGLLTGVIIIIPFASIVVVLVAASTTYLSTSNWGLASAVFGVGIAIQMLEAYLLTPWIIGKQLELHFIVIILSVFVFGELFGFFGVLLSVPMAAIAKILGREFLLPILKELASDTPKTA